MKAKISLLITISLFLLLFSSEATLFSDDNLLTQRQIYHKIKESYFKYMPNDFIAKVTGERINKSIRKIPENAICGKIRVSYLFLKGVAEKIVVENVRNPYIERFEPYLDTYKKANYFLKKDSSYEDFIGTYDWTYVNNTKDYYQFKLRRNNAKKGTFLYTYFDKKYFLLIDAYQFKRDKMTGHISIHYKRDGKMVIPNLLKFNIIDEKNKWVKFDLNFSEHKVNVGIDEDTMLEVQNDCVSLEDLLY